MSRRMKVAWILDPKLSLLNSRVLRWQLSWAAQIAAWLSADFHIYLLRKQNRAIAGALQSLKRLPRCGLHLCFVQEGDHFLEDVRREVEQEHPDLIVVGRARSSWPARGIHRPRLLEQLKTPILVLPRNKTHPSWVRSILVPLSGEVSPNAAMRIALEVGVEHKLPVDLLHFTEDRGARSCDASVVGHTADEAYHEYPLLQDHLIAQASPYATMKQRQMVRDFLHCTGATVEQTLRTVAKKGRPLVMLEWKGSLAVGRAQVIKRILEIGEFPVLLVKEEKAGQSRLHAGVAGAA